LISEGWTHVRVTYDASQGRVQAWAGGQTSPSLIAVDLSLGAGRVGLGSFFGTASFRNFKLSA
jgi:hypothetical protein